MSDLEEESADLSPEQRAAPGLVGLSLPFGPESAGIARAELSHWLDEYGEPDETVGEDARLVVSELVGNAVRHARPLADGTMQVQWTVDAQGGLDIAVSDGGSDTVPTQRAADQDEPGGRGLAIIASVSTEWWVDEAEDGTTVHARLNLPTQH